MSQDIFPAKPENEERKALGGRAYRVYIMEREREMERNTGVSKKRETTSPVPNMLLSLASPQSFNSAVLGTLQYLQFPLTLAGFTLTPFSPFLFRLHFILCYTKRSDGTFLYPR